LADEDLLRPSLEGADEAPSLFSSTGFFLVSFFAGPAAAGAYGIANSIRLRRWRQDLPVVVAVVAASFWLLLFASRHGGLMAFAELLGDRPSRAMQIAIRALGLACFAAIYLMHRQHYRAARVTGVEPVSGWVPGIVAFIVGLLSIYSVDELLKGNH
jgi:hypothetical protein